MTNVNDDADEIETDDDFAYEPGMYIQELINDLGPGHPWIELSAFDLQLMPMIVGAIQERFPQYGHTIIYLPMPTNLSELMQRTPSELAMTVAMLVLSQKSEDSFSRYISLYNEAHRNEAWYVNASALVAKILNTDRDALEQKMRHRAGIRMRVLTSMWRRINIAAETRNNLIGGNVRPHNRFLDRLKELVPGLTIQKHSRKFWIK